MEPNNNRNQNDNGNNKNKNIYNIIFIAVIAIMFVAFFNYMLGNVRGSNRKEIRYDEFLEMLEDGKIKNVFLTDDGTIEIKGTDMTTGQTGITYYTGRVTDPDLVTRLEEAGVEYSQEITDSSSGIISMIITTVLPFLILYGLLFFVFRSMSKNGGGLMGIGKSNAKVYAQTDTGVTFRDVAGQEEAKESLKEIVDFLHNPQKYTKIGAKLPKGALLVGPPGTGKTLLARAVAGEANAPFFSLSGSDFVEMYVGVGASRVRDLFKQAAQSAPCIIFIDELDAIGKSRDNRFGSNDEREQTLNQLLSEMDGFDASKGIIILAATNRPEILDKALLRPGRFDRRIIVERPDLKGRIDTLKVHARDVNMDETVDFKEIALATSGAVGSDLANIVNEAALNAVKNGRNAVSQKDLFESVEVVIAGKEKKDRVLSQEEKKIVAYHEVGHALCSAMQKGTEPVQKITIVPRTMGALGYTMQVPEEEKYLMSKDDILRELVILYGGRAAETVKFDSITTGASNDIERATQMARNMVMLYGMSDKFGPMGMATIENQYLDANAVKNISEETASEVDHEVMSILDEAFTKAKEILKDNMDALDRISEFLVEKETITGKEFMEILRKVEEDRNKTEEVSKAEDNNKTEEVPEAEDKNKTEEVSETENADAALDTEHPEVGD